MSSRINVSENDLNPLAATIIESLPVCGGMTVLPLTGDLGAGKTTFVQNLARVLGVTDVVQSPTFVLQKIYPTTHHRFTTLVHMDLYRLDTAAEVEVLQLEQWAVDPHALLCVEWPDRVAQWPGNVCVYPVHFHEVSTTERAISIEGVTLPSTN